MEGFPPQKKSETLNGGRRKKNVSKISTVPWRFGFVASIFGDFLPLLKGTGFLLGGGVVPMTVINLGYLHLLGSFHEWNGRKKTKINFKLHRPTEWYLDVWSEVRIQRLVVSGLSTPRNAPLVSR